MAPKRRDPLATLARLERQALDVRRGELVAAQGGLERLDATLNKHEAAWSEAMRLAVTSDSELDFWGSVTRGTRQVLDRTTTERAAQVSRVGEARDAVHASLVELKRLEVLAERRVQRRQAASAKAERLELDELATLRHGRR
jgi:flagellar export protein FliJ